MKNILFILALTILLASCRTTRQTTTTQINTDSIVTHVKDSMFSVHEKEIEVLQKHIEELSSSGVTFVTDSCPEREVINTLRDSLQIWGKEKIKLAVDKSELAKKLSSLGSKVTISEKGVITAEGPIKEAHFSKSLLQDELYKSERTIDSLHRELDSSNAKLSRVEIVKDKKVTKSRSPIWIFGLVAMIFFVFGWIVKARLTKAKAVTI